MALAACTPLLDELTGAWLVSTVAAWPLPAALATADVGAELPDASGFTVSTRPLSALGLLAVAACGRMTAAAVPAGTVEVSDVSAVPSCSPETAAPSFVTTGAFNPVAVFDATFVAGDAASATPVVTVAPGEVVACAVTVSATVAVLVAVLASPVLPLVAAVAASVTADAGVVAGVVPLAADWLAAIAAAAIASG